MFSDSNIAKKCTCGSDKVSYYITFGLGPHFKELLKKALNNLADGFVLLFDETLNRELEKKQMDIHVRYWEGEHVITRYYTSVFLGHSTAQDMLHKIQQHLDINTSKVVQLSMDGPNVNWSLFNLLTADLQKNVSSDFKFIDIGSCGLHTMHNAFRAGLKASGWDIGNFFSSLSWLFKDTPARREDFIEVTGSTEFPMDHCAHRWVENIPVAEQALRVWPNVKKFIHHVITTKKVPQTKSFQNLKDFLSDELLVPKLECFISIAKLLQPFLKKYQSEAPLLPYMAQDITAMLQSLIVRFVTSEVITNCKSARSLLSLDLKKQSNLLSPDKVDIGFKAKKALNHKSLSQRDIYQFQMQCRDFLKAVSISIIEKSPIKYRLVRNLKWLQPEAIIEDNSSSIKQLETALDCLVSFNKVNADKCDTIKAEYVQWHTSVLLKNSMAFSSFNCSKERLDEFYSANLGNTYPELWKVVRLLLLLSHGQAQVERGFSVNKETMMTNMQERTLVAKRTVCDYLTSIGGLKKLFITNSMRMAAASARSAYRLHLEEAIETEKRDTLKRKKQDDFEEIETMKAKKVRLQKDISALVSSADKLAEKAENSHSHSHKFIMESNALRRSAKEKEKEFNNLSQAIEEKVKEIGGL